MFVISIWSILSVHASTRDDSVASPACRKREDLMQAIAWRCCPGKVPSSQAHDGRETHQLFVGASRCGLYTTFPHIREETDMVLALWKSLGCLVVEVQGDYLTPLTSI